MWYSNNDGQGLGGLEWLQIDLGIARKVTAVRWMSVFPEKAASVEVRISDSPIVGGKQVVADGSLCFVMPAAVTDNVHDGGETDCGDVILGRYVVFTNPNVPGGGPWQVAEVNPVTVP